MLYGFLTVPEAVHQRRHVSDPGAKTRCDERQHETGYAGRKSGAAKMNACIEAVGSGSLVCDTMRCIYSSGQSFSSIRSGLQSM